MRLRTRADPCRRSLRGRGGTRPARAGTRSSARRRRGAYDANRSTAIPWERPRGRAPPTCERILQGSTTVQGSVRCREGRAPCGEGAGRRGEALRAPRESPRSRRGWRRPHRRRNAHTHYTTLISEPIHTTHEDLVRTTRGGIERHRVGPLPSRKDTRHPRLADARPHNPPPDPLLPRRKHAQTESSRHRVRSSGDRRYARRDALAPRRAAHERRLCVCSPAELRGDAVAVLERDFHAEVDVAGGARMLSRQAHLLQNLTRRPSARRIAKADAAGEITRPEVAALQVLLCPPGQQRGIALPRRLAGPAELRCEVVDPPLDEPFPRIGVDLLERVESLNRGRISRTPNPEGTHAEFDAGLRPLDRAIEIAHEHVDIAPPPVVP